MAKGKKKRKDGDFQKVKLKVGRKLKRDSNETKAEFSSRKIILKEVRSHSNDPLTALAHHSEHISQSGKISLLNHFNSALNPEIVKSLNKPILDSLSKFLIDRSDQVRSSTMKCLKTCFNHMKQQRLSTKEFLFNLKPYLDCAYTHVTSSIANDCQKFLEYFVNLNEPQIFEPLMHIVLRRYEAGNLSDNEKNLGLKLAHYFARHKQKKCLEEQLSNDKIERLYWSESSYHLDLEALRANGDGDDDDDSNTNNYINATKQREVLLIAQKETENIEEKFCSIFNARAEI